MLHLCLQIVREELCTRWLKASLILFNVAKAQKALHLSSWCFYLGKRVEARGENLERKMRNCGNSPQSGGYEISPLNGGSEISPQTNVEYEIVVKFRNTSKSCFQSFKILSKHQIRIQVDTFHVQSPNSRLYLCPKNKDLPNIKRIKKRGRSET